MKMMRSLEIKHTNVLLRNLEAYDTDGIRYIYNQGGSRSSKSISILQILIILALRNTVKITIARKTLAACKSIMDDFFGLMDEYELYKRDNHNKSLANYIFDNGSVIEFIGTSDPQKLRGRKRDILFCNEANEIDREEWIQLVLRTSGKIFLDFNPSDDEHWIYESLKDQKSTLIKSTYKDNPFLTKEQVEYIENLIDVDENYYKIYALGERPIPNTRIYTHFKQFVDIPEGLSKPFYGLDFGFNDPCALVKCCTKGDMVYVEEMMYKNKLTSNDLVNEINGLGLEKGPIYCDTARPEIIEDLRRAGYDVRKADKSINAGINSLKKRPIFIYHEAVNLLKEVRMYNWKTKGDKILDEPVDLNNHLMDALRYAVHSHMKSDKSLYLNLY